MPTRRSVTWAQGTDRLAAGLWYDVRHAARMLSRNGHYTALATLTTALGTGLVTAMCAVLNGTVWHPLAFGNADRLVALGGAVSSSTVLEWASAASFDGVAGYKTRRVTATGLGDPASLKATIASSSLFQVLGARAARGREFSPADDATGARPAVLGDEAWRTTFSTDPAVVGKTIYLNRVPFAIVGVMPAGFQFPTNVQRVDLYTTVAADLQADRHPAGQVRPRDLQVVALLKPGVGLERARAEMAVLLTGTDRTAKPVDPRGIVVPLARDVARDMVSPLTVLTWAVACVLAIACATVAVLALIQVTGRRHDLATRLAMGATRARLAQQAVVERLLVAGAGGALGALVAVLGARPLLAAAGPEVAAVARARLDVSVLAASLAVGMAAALVAALAPAMQAAATAWPSRGQDAASQGGGISAGALRRALVSVEVALMVVLLATCVSLLRGYLGLSRADPGFEASGVMTFRVDLSDALLTPAQQADVFERVRAALGRAPGVQSGAFSALLPFGDLRFTFRLDVPREDSHGAGGVGVEVHMVSPGFFHAMKIPLVEGRDFDGSDVSGRPRVAIVSRRLAAQAFAEGDPVGRVLDVPGGMSTTSNPLARVIGVVGDVRNGTLSTAADPQLYLPYSQAPLLGSATFVVRVPEGDPDRAMAVIRRMVRDIDASAPVVDQRPLEDYVGRSLVRARFNALLTGVFADGAIAWLVVRHGLETTAFGLAAGTAGAAVVTRLLTSVLYGVQPGQAATLGVAAGAGAAAALVALCYPARSAARGDLRGMLRDET
jgi:putative ABC transport system permease protein